MWMTLCKKDGMEAVRLKLLVVLPNVLTNYKTGVGGKECDSNKRWLIVVKRWRDSEADMIRIAPNAIWKSERSMPGY
jgi:hypothetical protein